MSEFEVEIVFALREMQSLRSIVVESGTTVAEVVAMSGVCESFLGYGLDEMPVGIWGREVDRNRAVKEGDRIEIYRPLELDPREARRQLALIGRTMGSADSA